MALQNALLPVPEDSTETLPPAPNAGLTPTNIQRVGRSLDNSVPENTRAMYASAWRSFEAWTQARGNLSLPAAPALVAAYLAHLAEERHLLVLKKPSDLAVKLAALELSYRQASQWMGSVRSSLCRWVRRNILFQLQLKCSCNDGTHKAAGLC